MNSKRKRKEEPLAARGNSRCWKSSGKRRLLWTWGGGRSKEIVPCLSVFPKTALLSKSHKINLLTSKDLAHQKNKTVFLSVATWHCSCHHSCIQKISLFKWQLVPWGLPHLQEKPSDTSQRKSLNQSLMILSAGSKRFRHVFLDIGALG